MPYFLGDFLPLKQKEGKKKKNEEKVEEERERKKERDDKIYGQKSHQ